jgi:CRISPR-associated protein Csm1
LEPPERLSLFPWLPDAERNLLTIAEQEILRYVETWIGPIAPEAVALQTPFAALQLPAINELPACHPPPATFWQPAPESLPLPTPPLLESGLQGWRKAVAEQRVEAATSPLRRYALLYGAAQTHLRCLAASPTQPDVPLLEHLQLASALAACLWQARQSGAQDNGLALLVADLSGIQSYLFELANVGVGGVARSLRARSFLLSQITTLFAWSLLDRLGLPPSNLLLDSGGKFYLLFAPTPDALSALEQAQREAAAWFLKTLNGELVLNVAQTTFAPAKLEAGQFSDVWQAVNREMAQRKQQRLAAVLQDATGWNEQVFLRPDPFQGTAPCRVCGKLGRAPGQENCHFCQRDIETGRRIARAAWIAYDRGEEDASHPISAFGWRVQIGQQGEPVPADAEWVWRLDTKPPPTGSSSPYRLLARYVPTEDKSRAVLTFEEIARQARGRPYLAYLKADVDRLGERFIYGFRRANAPSLDSPARLAHLSRALETFFAGWLEQTVRTRFPACYVVFSGGDDLTIIGPHDQIVRLAWTVNRTFRRFQGYPEGPSRATDALTLSAGIAFLPMRRPVATAMKLTEEELHTAKTGGRNAISLLGRTLSWSEFDALFAQLWTAEGQPAPGLGTELLDSARTPSAFLYHLLQYAQMWERYRQGHRGELRYQPLLAYDISRNLNENRTPHLHSWASWLAQIPVTAGEDWKLAMDNLGVVTRLVLLHRGGAEHHA